MECVMSLISLSSQSQVLGMDVTRHFGLATSDQASANAAEQAS
jgi:hypothetical protein